MALGKELYEKLLASNINLQLKLKESVLPVTYNTLPDHII